MSALNKYALLAASIVSIHATAGQLIEIAKSENNEIKYFLNPDTISSGENKKGDEFASAVFEVQNKNKVHIERKYVTRIDCRRGYGKLVTLTTDGKFDYENDFLLSGESIASVISEFLCGAYKSKDSEISIQSKNEGISSAEKKWKETIDEFIATEALRPGGINYNKDSKKMKLLDSYVKALANAPENSEKPMLWFLTEADRLVKLKYTY